LTAGKSIELFILGMGHGHVVQSTMEKKRRMKKKGGEEKRGGVRGEGGAAVRGGEKGEDVRIVFVKTETLV